MSAHTKIRTRLSSVGDSAPPSDSSEGSGSESFENVPEWTLDKNQNPTNALFISSDNDLNHHSLSPDNSGALTDNERAQVESFFSGLGTEVTKIMIMIIIILHTMPANLTLFSIHPLRINIHYFIYCDHNEIHKR